MRTIPPLEIIRGAREWLNVPFAHQGRSRVGIDCVGEIVCVLRGCGYVIEDFTTYGRTASPKDFIAHLEKNFIRLSMPVFGCVVAFWLAHRTIPQHTAFYAGKTIIHAYADDEFVREEEYTGRWERHFHSAWGLRPELVLEQVS